MLEDEVVDGNEHDIELKRQKDKMIRGIGLRDGSCCSGTALLTGGSAPVNWEALGGGGIQEVTDQAADP